jgi:hypothetical protein
MIKTDMDSVTEAYKNKIEERLAQRLIKALHNKEVTKAELATISTYILENIDEAQTNSDLLKFLEDVAKKWPFLSTLANAEQAGETELKNKETILEAGRLIGENKIEEALSVVKNATDQKTGGEN